MKLSDEQQAVRASARELFARVCPPAAVRAAWNGERPAARWGELVAAGLANLFELGMGELEMALVLEEAGRAALPEPLLETGMVAAPLLGARGRVAAGGPLVADADLADVLLLEDGEGLVALPPSAVRLTPVDAVDRARRLFRVEPRGDGERVGGPAEARAAADRGALGAAAMLVGLGRRMLDMTVAYVKVRQQFGKPVGSFQAVKHHLAGALVALELCEPTVWRAAVALARREAEAPVRVSMAKAGASDAAQLAARVALQCHGAIGYAYENDLQMWMKRTWALAASWGDARWHRARVAEAVLDHGLELEMGE